VVVIHDEHGLPKNYIPLNVDSVYRQNRTGLSYSTSVFDYYCGTAALRNHRDVHAAIPVDQHRVADADIPGDSSTYVA
jgi:hypothetical protein